jgi:hypothetical protein
LFFEEIIVFRSYSTVCVQRVPLVEQELLILPEHMSSTSVFSRFITGFVTRVRRGERFTKKNKIHIKLNIKYSKSTKNVG